MLISAVDLRDPFKIQNNSNIINTKIKIKIYPCFSKKNFDHSTGLDLKKTIQVLWIQQHAGEHIPPFHCYLFIYVGSILTRSIRQNQ